MIAAEVLPSELTGLGGAAKVNGSTEALAGRKPAPNENRFREVEAEGVFGE